MGDWMNLITGYFNSRPREGANNVYPAGISCAVVFQFPPPRGGEQGRLLWRPAPV